MNHLVPLVIFRIIIFQSMLFIITDGIGRLHILVIRIDYMQIHWDEFT